MTVYFLRPEGINRVKIGYTQAESPEERLKSLQSGSPVKLEVIAVWPQGTQRDETLTHQRFEKKWLHCEWFVLDAEVAEFIAYVSHFNTSAGFDKWCESPDRFAANVRRFGPKREVLSCADLPAVDIQKHLSRLQRKVELATGESDFDWRRFMLRWECADVASVCETQWAHWISDKRSGPHLSVFWVELATRTVLESKSPMQETARALTMAAPHKERVAAIWVQAYLKSIPEDARIWESVPFLEPLERACADALGNDWKPFWHHKSRHVLPIKVVAPEGVLGQRDLASTVQLLRAAVLSSYAPAFFWLEGACEYVERELAA